MNVDATEAVQAFERSLSSEARLDPAESRDDGSTVVPVRYMVGSEEWTYEACVWPRGNDDDIEPATSGEISAVQADKVILLHRETGRPSSQVVQSPRDTQ
ncbi:hypothetical protein BN12_1230021 [Nostocoides japonicum T1-X7]|uniref:Uncharacterized protein n=1 Tax=Nostocoides japonicum T1-X7 TaxID=1194083 RepID=A0A077LSZ1_9MICO|nr:hypothetical protein BN12_1230021 [Tetrasphaera japonica T1-X7]